MSPSRAEQAPHVRNWQSVRTVLEGLILIALCWSAKSLTETQTQLAVLQVDIANLRTQLAPLANLDQRVTRLEALAERPKDSR